MRHPVLDGFLVNLLKSGEILESQFGHASLEKFKKPLLLRELFLSSFHCHTFPGTFATSLA